MTEVEEWEEEEGGQRNWVNDLRYELLGSQRWDELKLETEWKERRNEGAGERILHRAGVMSSGDG